MLPVAPTTRLISTRPTKPDVTTIQTHHASPMQIVHPPIFAIPVSKAIVNSPPNNAPKRRPYHALPPAIVQPERRAPTLGQIVKTCRVTIQDNAKPILLDSRFVAPPRPQVTPSTRRKNSIHGCLDLCAMKSIPQTHHERWQKIVPLVPAFQHVGPTKPP